MFCGNLVVSDCENFVMDYWDYVVVEDCGEVIVVVYSYLDKVFILSMVDRVSCEFYGLLWGIIGLLSGEMFWFKFFGYCVLLFG